MKVRTRLVDAEEHQGETPLSPWEAVSDHRAARESSEGRSLRDVTSLTGAALMSSGVILCAAAAYAAAKTPLYPVNVDVVQLSFTATDAKGRYMEGLTSDDLVVSEDGAP